jgi:D-3-phosphoglycerate dehydrogenase
MNLVNVLITGKLHDIALQMLRRDPALRIEDRPDCPKDYILTHGKNVNILVTRSETTVDKEIMDACPELRFIFRAAVGVGNIDLPYATQKGILVVNVPGKNTNSAAEMTMALLLSMLRNVVPAQTHMKSGGWDRHRFNGKELRGKSVGIVGLGNVGHRVAKFCQGFDMPVFAYDPYISPKVFAKYGVKLCPTLKDLASHVDILTLHVPLNQETKGMITSEVLSAMKKGSYLVNAARGGIVREKDLLNVLETGHLAGVALDTFESEPNPLPELIAHPKVWCSPHIGASTDEAQIAIGETVADQILKVIKGGVADHPVNLPEIGIQQEPIIAAYSVLAEKLGSMVGQILTFNPRKIVLAYRGDIAKRDHAMIRLSWMKGYVSHIVDDYVSFVNVKRYFEGMEIKLEEREDDEFTAYKSAIKVTIEGDDEQLEVGGVVFDDRYLRLTLINDFYFEVEPSGPALIVENFDRPGVVGNVGSFLAQHGINISSFHLSRNKKGGMAMSIINIDGELKGPDLAAMKKLENIKNVKCMVL